MTKAPHPIFLKSLYGLATIFFLSALLFIRTHKEKDAFNRINGQIIYLETFDGMQEMGANGKYRFLRIDHHPKTFELFIGKDAGDFRPRYEAIDSLSIGDEVAIYYDENSYTEGDPVNRLVHYIDKSGRPVFIRGSWERTISYCLIGLGFLILCLLVWLKKKGKIA